MITSSKAALPFTPEQWDTTMCGLDVLAEFETDDEQLEAFEACRPLISAAPKLYAALSRIEAGWRCYAEAIKHHPDVAAATEMAAIYHEACTALADARDE
jgi:hypothetical protein